MSYQNNENLKSLFTQRLRESPYWTAKTQEVNGMVNFLTCPACGESEAFCYAHNPFVVFCHRQKRCGVRTLTKALFPDIIQHIERRFPPTQLQPDRPAEEFLRSRGLSKSIEGLRFKYTANVRKSGSGAVMFRVGESAGGDPVWNGRLFNPPHGQGKTHNQGSTKGMVWKHQGISYDPNQDVYVTEGIINALSLIEMGLQAVAVLSSGQKPEDVTDLTTFGKPIFAFDQDEAGAHATQKWMEIYKPRGARAILPKKGDWNDHLCSYGTTEFARQKFDEKKKEYEFKARLALAESAQAYAEVWNGYHGGTAVPGLFVFNGQYFWSFAKEKGEALEIKTFRVSNFTVSVDHYQLDRTNAEEPEYRFSLIIRPRKGKPTHCSVTASELATPSAMTILFLTRAGVLWEGERQPTLALVEHIVESKAPVVRQLITTGYDPDSKCYVFPHYAIDHNGKNIERDIRGFFPILQGQSLRSAPFSTIKPEEKPRHSLAHIWTLCFNAWGEHAAVAIAWTAACWWVNQIKDAKGFFPFLSLWGDPGTGKSRLARTLNAMQGLDEEGMPMNRVNTAKGEIRKLSQLSGLFKGLLESTEDAGTRRFDLDTILPLYNSNPLQVTALKTTDSQTRELPFRASLLFIQNPNIFKTRPQQERVISLRFLKENLTDDTFAAFTALTEIPLPEIAAFMPTILNHRSVIEGCCAEDTVDVISTPGSGVGAEGYGQAKAFSQSGEVGWIKQHIIAKEELRKHVRDNRLVENYAIILAWHRMIMPIIGIEYDLLPFIVKLIKAKRDECENRQDDPAEYFLGLLPNITWGDSESPAWQKEEGRLYVHLPEAIRLIQHHGYTIPAPISILQETLKRHPAFVKSNYNYRMTRGFAVELKKVWVFDSCYLD